MSALERIYICIQILLWAKMNKIFSLDEALAVGGGEFKPNAMPQYVDYNLIEGIASSLSALSPVISTEYDIQLNIKLTNRLGIRSFILPVGEAEYVCMVPVGLIVRLDYLVRLLEREAGKEAVHVVDPTFYGDLPDDMQTKRLERPLPVPMNVLADPRVMGDRFWDTIKHLESDDIEMGRSSYRYLQIDQIRLAVQFCALHESCHAFRRHHKILTDISKTEHLRRGAELDADYQAAMWQTNLRVMVLSSLVPDEYYKATIIDSSWRMTYAFCLVLGLFDNDRFPLTNFESDGYHHPTARLFLMVDAMLRAFGRIFSPEAAVQDLIEPSGRAASEYMTRITHLWRKIDPESKCRRCTSLYYPFMSDYDPISYPEDVPTMEKIQRKAQHLHSEFLREYDVILNSKRKNI